MKREMKPSALALGLDMGTTTISAVVLDPARGEAIESRTLTAGADIPSPHPWERTQDVELLEERALKLANDLLAVHPGIAAIGLTGQMHGILYLDGAGMPCSPLYTWQDGRAGLGGAESPCERLRAATGYPLAPGYGVATHYALLEQNQVPPGAERICTVMDYLAFALSGRRNLRIHGTNAASMGCFDLLSGDFDREALRNAGIDPDILPPVTGDCGVMGERDGIPVAVAIGDNQASFLGSVAEPHGMALANFGTGSQISLLAERGAKPSHPGVEVRPCFGDGVLLSGSALSGGRAYALLEGFFRTYATACGLPDGERYEVLNRLALTALREEDPMAVETTFSGTRWAPGKRGAVTNIAPHNFTPGGLAAGVLRGMGEELRAMFRSMPGAGVTRLIASGNAVRKNPALRLALEQVFEMPVSIPVHREEAAYGAAMFAAAAAGFGELEDLSRRCVRYENA